MKAVFVAVGAVAFVVSPLASGSFGGYDPSQFPVPQERPPAQPAGWAFSIWSLIYAWLVAHAVFGLLRRADDPGWDRTRWPMIFSLVVGAAWIPVAQISPLWATLLIWVMLVAALFALFAAPEEDAWWAKFPIAFYAGWLTAASWVSVALIGAGWGIGPGALIWAWIALGGLMIFAALVQVALGRVMAYAVPIAWALFGIAAANNTDRIAITAAAIVAAAGLISLSAQRRWDSPNG
nr:tryptophan-rich sensory protein [Pseudoruegeria sp. HB172150]